MPSVNVIQKMTVEEALRIARELHRGCYECGINSPCSIVATTANALMKAYAAGIHRGSPLNGYHKRRADAEFDEALKQAASIPGGEG